MLPEQGRVSNEKNAEEPPAGEPNPGSEGLARVPGPSETVAARRGILKTLLGSALGVGFALLGAVGGLWAAATARFFMPNVTAEPADRFRAGYPRDYPPGWVETKYKDRYGVWIVHGTYRGRSQIFALRTVCTHLGCITIWQESEQKFKCPCHGSGFHPDGTNFEGPAPRPLERYAIRIAEDGQLEVDRSRIYQQELGQWEDPRSFVEGPELLRS